MKTEIDHSEPTAPTACVETTHLNSPAVSNDTRVTSSFKRFSAACLRRWSEVKERVRRQLVAEYGASLGARLIQQVLHEADSLASTTPFPTLFLPVLAEEKVRSAAEWNARQRAIRDHAVVLAV